MIRLMPEPRVLLLPADETGCGVYRMIYVARILAERGHDVRVAPPGHPDRLAAFLRAEPRKVQGKWTSVERVERVVIPEADVVVFQRPLSRLYADAMGQLRAAGIKIIVELDDDFRAVSPANGAYRAVHPGYSPEANWQHLDRSLRAAHLVTVSTESLARRYGHKGVERVVLPNYVPAWYLDIPHDPGPARAGWAGAVNTHPFDLQATGGGIASALRRAREDRGPEAGRFTVVGPTTGVAAALGLSEQVVDASDWVPTAQYPAELAKRLTVGVAPLEDTLFNRGKCLDASTRVATRRGHLLIEEIVEGDMVWSDGRWVAVEATERGATVRGVEMVTSSGRVLRLSLPHRLMVNGSWRQAGEVQAGDMVKLTRDAIAVGDQVRVPWPADSRMSRRTGADPMGFVTASDGPTVEITERWGRVLGLFAGDGCAYRSRVSFSCDGQDADLIETLASDLVAMGFHPFTEAITTRDGKAVRRRSVTVASAHLVRFLRHLGVADERRRVVCVPDVIWRSPRPVAAAFLAGLFEADGTIEGSGMSMTTKNHEFALDVQRLLTAFGIESFVKERWTSATPGGILHRSYLVRLRRAGTDLFAEIGFLSERKRARLAKVVMKPHSNAYRPQAWEDEVVSVGPCVIEPVDLQVAGSVFAASGFVSHNSWLKPLEYAALGIPSVMTPLPEYQALAEAGIGQLATKSNQWQHHVAKLLTDDDYRTEEGARVRQVVADQFTLEAHAHRWWEAWTSVL